MLRTHTCGELTLQDAGKEVTLSGWVFRSRDQGGMIFIDLRDRYGITQLVFLNPAKTADGGQLSGISQKLYDDAKTLGREYVIKARGKVQERAKNNPNLSTGEIEVLVESLELLNASKTPPFTLEEETDGGDELRMKYRYIDLRRDIVKNNLLNRHKVAKAVREYLDEREFVDIETPFLIKSTPEGARDFVVPSSMNKGEFYALPQSPQTFKQLLMVAGFDRYYQIIRCFRDEDLRADRQPEFTQIDCEMAFVEQEDVLNMFEGMVKHVFKKVRGIEFGTFPRMTFADALKYYGNDKPDTRFGMLLQELTGKVKFEGFNLLEQAEYVGAICVPGASEYTRKQIDELTEFIKRPQIGAKGLIYIKYSADGTTLKSSIDKFAALLNLENWIKVLDAKAGDLVLIIAGDKATSRRALSELRLRLKFCDWVNNGNCLNKTLRDVDFYKPNFEIDTYNGKNLCLGFKFQIASKLGQYLLKEIKSPNFNNVVIPSKVHLDDFTAIISYISNKCGKNISGLRLMDIGSTWESNNNLTPFERDKICQAIGATLFDFVLLFTGSIDEVSESIKRLKDFIGDMTTELNGFDNYYETFVKGFAQFKPLWVLDFPLLEADKDTGGWVATHHPFTSWKKEDEHYFETDPGKIRANAYDLVINGVELSSGSIRIHDRAKQEKMFNAIGLTKENYEKKFAFILNAFEYGAPPHGGIAFGFDRFCSICVANEDYIRDFIAFPKNNAGRDTMIDTPSTLSEEQLKELGLKVELPK